MFSIQSVSKMLHMNTVRGMCMWKQIRHKINSVYNKILFHYKILYYDFISPIKLSIMASSSTLWCSPPAWRPALRRSGLGSRWGTTDSCGSRSPVRWTLTCHSRVWGRESSWTCPGRSPHLPQLHSVWWKTGEKKQSKCRQRWNFNSVEMKFACIIRHGVEVVWKLWVVKGIENSCVHFNNVDKIH